MPIRLSLGKGIKFSSTTFHIITLYIYLSHVLCFCKRIYALLNTGYFVRKEYRYFICLLYYRDPFRWCARIIVSNIEFIQGLCITIIYYRR